MATNKKADGDDAREYAIATVSQLMREMPFKVEFVAKKNPEGIKIIIETTPQQLDKIFNK